MRYMLKAIAAYLARTIEFVFEGGKWIARAVTGSTPVEPHVSAAQEAAEAELDFHEAADRLATANDVKHEAETAVQHKWPVAVAVKEYMWSQQDGWILNPASIDHLPENVRAWVESLHPDDARHVRQVVHLSDLERHLTGGRQIGGLPRLASTADLIAKAEAAAAERQAAMDILQELIDEDEPRGRRAA